jgi:hypothetical protein
MPEIEPLDRLLVSDLQYETDITPATTLPEKYFAQIAETLKLKPGVAEGSWNNGSQARALYQRSEVFAFLSLDGRLVVRLPERRIEQWLVLPGMERFNHGHGTVVRGWLEVSVFLAAQWLALCREALTFVSAGVGFDAVFQEELDCIDTRRGIHDRGNNNSQGNDGRRTVARRSLSELYAEARGKRIVGLAFSGGGIRSATFNLGVLQGLANLGLIKDIDYLSTVSGGGYIGSWFTTWIRHCQTNGQTESAIESKTEKTKTGIVELRLQTGNGTSVYDRSEQDPDPIRHLRRHTNYLAPREGFLSADRWVLFAIYLRNFLLNQLVLLPATVIVLILSRIALLKYYPTPGRAPDQWLTTCGIGLSGFAAFAMALDSTRRVRPKRGADSDGPNPHNNVSTTTAKNAQISRDAALRMLLLTLIVLGAALLFCRIVPYSLSLDSQAATELWLKPPVFFAITGAVVLLAGYLFSWLSDPSEYRRTAVNPLLMIPGSIVSGAVGGAGLYGVYLLLHRLFIGNGDVPLESTKIEATALVTTFGPPLILAVLVVAIIVGVGILKRRLREELREWWASLCGRFMVAATIWMAVNLVALYATPLVLWLGPWVQTALASGWLVTVAGGVLAGNSSRTGGSRPQGNILDWGARLAVPLFVAGILVLVSILVHELLDNPPRFDLAREDALPWRIEPEHPSTKVTLTSGPDQPSVENRRDTKEYQIMLGDAALAQERYWLGMLNAKPDYIPTVEYYYSKGDFEQPRAELRKEVMDALDKLPLQSTTYDGFMKSLDDALHGILVSPFDKEVILFRCRHVKPIEEIEDLRRRYIIPLLVFALVLAFAVWRVDVNVFSLHGLYGNRLVRAYLGASRKRDPDPVVGFDPDDDIPLDNFRLRDPGQRGDKANPQKVEYDGPFLIVNTALNLVRTKELAWQERKAESFVLTPCHCGSETTRYRRTEGGPEGYAGGVSLGTAITISGAAASPNMGYHSSPAVTVLLTLFNARLGAWLGNPKNEITWQYPGPRMGFVHLFKELFGWTNDTGKYVYLSDGGHFENLGVYELVRRRCQYIIVSDAGADLEHTFEDVGNLIRKVRIDLGIRIEIDLGVLRLSGDEKRCRWHCAIGKIRYEDVDSNAAPGVLVYIKPSLTGDEPADVLHYATSHPTFPHESTGNQFYTESQFESYRALGQHVLENVFQQSVSEMNEALRRWPEAGRSGALFASLLRCWFAMPPEYEKSFVECTQAYVKVQDAFRNDPRLWQLTLDIYPELAPAARIQEARGDETVKERLVRRSAEIHIITQMLQAMENAWLSLNLDVTYAHPLNRGWMDVFHRWTSAVTVRKHWPTLRAEFGRSFVRFCEKQMRFGEVEGKPVPLRSDTLKLLDRLRLEFADQWLDYKDWLSAEIERAINSRTGWLIYPDNPYPDTPTTRAIRNDDFPVGVILVTPLRDGDFSTCRFFVWMRGAYRNTGLGRFAVREILAKLPKLIFEKQTSLENGRPKTFRLRIDLPVADLTGPGGKLQKGMWLTFFDHLDFIRQADENGMYVLVRDFEEDNANCPAWGDDGFLLSYCVRNGSPQDNEKVGRETEATPKQPDIES